MLKKINFLSINIISSSFLFTRSVLFLKFLPSEDLGSIMLLQSIIAILGLAQIGLFNGGFRIFSIDTNANQYQTVNNSNVTFIILLTLSLVLLAIFASSIFEYDLAIFTIAVFASGFALLKNWFTNLLIARKKLREINILNSSSSIASAIFALLIFKLGITGAIISIVSTYVVFVIIFMCWQKQFLPNKFIINFHAIKRMLYYGFIPYLSGIAVLLNNQIDRIFIVKAISLESLGQLYLAITFFTVFDLFPANLDSLLVPNAINNYNSNKLKETLKDAKIFFYILIGYSLLAVAALILIGERVTALLFPDKISQLKYLFIMLPGVIAITLSKPFSFILYVSLNLKAILWSNIFSLSTYLQILVILLYFHDFTLENVAYGKSIQGILVMVFLIVATFFRWKKISNFAYVKSCSNI